MIYLGNQAVGVGVGGLAKSGTFTGNGTITQALDVGFEPDVIVVDSDLDFSVAGWQGIKCVTIVKGVMTVNFVHTNTTTTSSSTYNTPITSTDDPWGESAGAYRSCASYADGVLTLTNKTNNANGYYKIGRAHV